MPFSGTGTGIQNADDVFFSNLAQNDALRYNSVTAKWNNGALSVGSSEIADNAITEPKLAISNSPGTDQVLSWNGSELAWATPATGGGSIAVEDEGSNLTSTAAKLNFTGAGVVATNSGNDVTVSINGTAAPDDGTRLLDSFAGASDDDKLTAAIAWQQGHHSMPAIRLAAREHTFNQTRQLYSGLKLVGTPAGPRNLEQNPAYTSTHIRLGNGISSGTSSWWVTPGGNLFDIYMADFAVQGNSGSSRHQFIDVTTGSLYACQFHALSFNMMRGVFGRKDRKCLLTQTTFSGHWTALNLWDTQFHLGGADNNLWMDGYINIGVSSSPAQTGSYGDNDYELIFGSLTKTNVGYIFMSALNGWRGLRVTGSAGHGLRFFGGSYEGYKGSNDNLAAPGTVIRLDGGAGAFFSPSVGQAMQNPNSAERAPIQVTGGEWSFHAPCFYKGSTMTSSDPFIYHSGGRVYVTGAGTNRNNGETWSSRPRYESTSGGPNATDTSFYCPDMSMVSV
ncbi:hypothetical protein CSA80_03145 [Candidatus Saccharibacteria bacterium]|nr:MAG: hypothetical protein CSA80_03145 [Candidatus Saccharibacteria bacterium]